MLKKNFFLSFKQSQLMHQTTRTQRGSDVRRKKVGLIWSLAMAIVRDAI